MNYLLTVYWESAADWKQPGDVQTYPRVIIVPDFWDKSPADGEIKDASEKGVRTFKGRFVSVDAALKAAEAIVISVRPFLVQK